MSLTDQQWYPTSVQVTALQARGLRIKGKSGTNDAYAVMQVGKEKYQTSVVEKSVAPVWKEEAAFDLPSLPQGGGGGGGGSERCTLHVHVLHRALVGPDKLLGQAVINLLQLSEDKTRNKTEWFKLLDKTGKADKDRGEVLVDIQFMRNNMTASMFDISAAGKSRSRLGKFKDKVRGKKKESDAASTVVPSFTQVLTDSEEEGNGDGEIAADEKKKKHKMKSLFSPKSNLQKNMSQSMSVLPGKNSSLSGSQSSGLNVDSSEGKRKFKFMIHKRSGSSDSKDSSSGHQKHGAAEQSNLCINGSHIYCEEQQPRTSRIGSNFSLASSGHGSMEDVPESSPPSVDSLKAVRQYSPWTEEEEEEEEKAKVENIKEDVGELRREEEKRIRMEEERRRKEEEEMVRRQEEEEELERLAEEKRTLEEEERRRIEEEKVKREEEERIRREEEERAQEERRQEEEERVRREEERERLAEEKRRLEDEERRIEEEKVKREEEERIRREEEMAQEERRQEEEERARRQEEERERLAEEKRKLEEQERRIEEEEKRQREEEERIRMEEEMAQEERKRQEEKERAKRQEEERKLAEEKRRLEDEERRIEEERVKREEEERIRREEEMAQEERKRQEEKERARRQECKLAEEKRRLEDEERRIEEEKVRKEEEQRIRVEEERRKEEEEMVRRREEELEERRRLEELRIKKEEEEKARREQEEYERLVEDKRKLEEEERKRIEAEDKIRKEEEERIRVEEERRRKEEEEERVRRQLEHEKLAEEKRILEEQERRRIEDEEKRQREEEERIRKEEERRREEEERARKEKEEMERLAEEKRLEEQEKRSIEEEERIRREEKAKGKKCKVAVESPAEVSSNNPFDENFSNNPFEEIPNSPAGPDSSTARVSTVQQRCQSTVSSVGSKTVSTDEKDLISTQREKRLAPQPPGRNQAERQSQKEQDGSTQHLAQINKQSKDKDVKTVSVLPQRSVQMIAPLSRIPTDVKNTQSLLQSSTTKGTSNVAKHSKRPAPSRPRSVEEGSSSEPKTAKQEPIVYGLNPFEDDEDENELTAQDDTTTSGNIGSIQWPPAMSQAADKDAASQTKIKSSKMAHAPPLPAKKAAISSTLINQNTEDHVTDDTGVTVPNNSVTHARDPESEAISRVHVQETPLQESQPATVQSAGEQAGGKKEGPPTTSRRLQPVKPLNPLEQQSVSVVQGEKNNKSTEILCEVQEKTKVNDTGLKGPYSQLTQEELISLVLKQGNQLSERDKKISELEQYIDNLLVRVIEEQPSILMSLNSLKKAV